MILKSVRGTPVITIGKKQYQGGFTGYFSSENITALLLNSFKKQYGVTTIGFYLMKKLKGWDAQRLFGDRYNNPEGDKLRNQFSKDKVAVTKKDGYSEFYIVNAKDMNVQNTDLSAVNGDMKAGRIKQLFSKSMTGRIKSRVLLNKFIEQVA